MTDEIRNEETAAPLSLAPDKLEAPESKVQDDTGVTAPSDNAPIAEAPPVPTESVSSANEDAAAPETPAVEPISQPELPPEPAPAPSAAVAAVEAPTEPPAAIAAV